MPDHYTPKEMLAKLVAFPSVSRDSNLAIIEFIEDYLAGHGVAARRVYSDDGAKANLYALVGPEVAGGVVLSGHTDVVPTDGQDWATDPFELVEKDGKLYGRGACDMKGFDALALALVPEMLAAKLKRPIQIALSYDEEVGCLGAPRMIAEMRETLPPASAVIVGEPSMMQTVTGHKGVIGFVTHVHGYEVHSSILHTGVSAVMTAAKLVAWHDARMAENRAAASVGADRVSGQTSDQISGPSFNPPYTTLHVGVIHGGTAGNITAKDCEFLTDIRVLPGESVDAWRERYQAYAAEVEAEIRKVRPEARIDVRARAVTPGCRREENGAAEALVRALTGDNSEHVVSYCTEAGQFQDEGYSTVICGPGSIAQAHQPNEFISVEQLDAGAAFMRCLIARLAH